MSKRKEAVFLKVYVNEEGKQTFSETRKQKQLVDGVETEIDVPNEQLPFTRGMNRKAKRIIAAHNRKAK